MTSSEARHVFVTGGTGYLGAPTIRALLDRGHRVRALVRAGSERKLPSRCEPVLGDALDARTFADRVTPADTFVHLVGVSKPSPAKALEFVTVDQASLRASMAAARDGTVRHFVYVSVAQPAPVMKAYVSARAACEAWIRELDWSVTILRPWYVIGPRHRWPLFMWPVYKLLEAFPASREPAVRLGFVSREQMVNAMVRSIEEPPIGARVLGVAEIRAMRRDTAQA